MFYVGQAVKLSINVVLFSGNNFPESQGIFMKMPEVKFVPLFMQNMSSVKESITFPSIQH